MIVDVRELVAELRALVEGARSMPMSASVVVNRTDVLDLVERLEAAVPSAFADQDQLDAERAAVLAAAGEEARSIVAAAEQERDRLAGESEVLRAAQQQADTLREQAAVDATELRQETDEYVDARLATFEVTLTKILAAVTRGRSRLHGRSHFDALGEPAASDAVLDADGEVALSTPEELRPPSGESL
jgi:hypothetical protein